MREGRVGQLGAAAPQRGQPPVDRRAAGRAGPRPARPSPASSARTSRGPAGRGPRRGPSPCARTPRLRPSAVALASSGSGWEVKNWNGVDAAHSSPMNSIGVNGRAERQQRPRTASWPSSRFCGEPVADARGCRPGRGSGCRPRSREAGHRRGVERAAVVAGRGTTSTCRRGRSRCSQHLAPALAAARSRRSSPAVSPVSAACRAWWKSSLHCASARSRRASRGRDQPRVVEVGLGDQRQRPAAGAPTGRRSRSASSSQDVDVGGVDQRVHGVEPQAVDVEVAQPASARCR